ncbi:hypothetical protein K490DRAFT_12485, partial [Saccharata proteae CBS 121410]
LLSPPPSSIASSNPAAILPHPRSRPLRSGGPKESAFIRYVDEQLRLIQGRFVKRGARSHIAGDAKGYANFKEAARDLEKLIDVVWVSGTPSLQIAYLLSLAALVNDYMAAFPPAPRPLFRVLGKLDHAFASLLQGQDVETGESLPGFEGGRGVSGTEKVRIFSMVKTARVGVVHIMSGAEPSSEVEDVTETEAENEDMSADESAVGGDVMALDDDDEDEDDTWDVNVAKVYDKTMVELGDDIVAAPTIGMRTET